MRRIYLIRHGKTDSQGMCIGRTDIPLCEDLTGIFQEQRAFFQKGSYIVYTSPLQRTRDTAAALFTPESIAVCEDLMEIDMGEWENLPFSEIRKRWPELYEQRGQEPYRTRAPKGESMEETASRMERFLKGACVETDRDLVLVTHSGCIKSLLYKMGYVKEEKLLEMVISHHSLTVFTEENGEFSLETLGFCPYHMMTDEMIHTVYQEWELPEKVIAHMEAVTGYALDIGERLNQRGYCLNLSILEKACRLHDIARLKKNHPAVAAAYLRKRGYYELAAVIEPHHDMEREQAQIVSEAMILYYADKCFCGAQRVSVEERFAQSWNKCISEEAQYNFKKRYEVAKTAEETLKKKLGYQEAFGA